VRYFFDNCISRRLAHSIRALAEEGSTNVFHLRDRFGTDVPDIEWIRTLGSEGDWTIISGDNRILKSPHERHAWREAKLTGFFWSPGWMKLKLWDQAWRLVRWWPGVEKQAALIEPGAAFEVPVKHTSKFRQL
jgi:hypothetical protein